MDRRKLGAGLTVFISSLLLLAGSASARSVTPQTESASCKIRSLPSFIAQGEFESSATVADVIEVSCDPYTYSAGAPVTITASQLYSRCKGDVTWYDPNEDGEFTNGSGRSFEVHLDVNGNANVALIAGPNCMVGESLITVDENESPFETFTTNYRITPTENTTPGLFMTPAAQVEDAESSAVITIAQAEYKGSSESHVRLGYEQLADRCEKGPGAIVIKADREQVPYEEELENAIELDNNSNGFAIIAGVDSCAEGKSLIESDLESSPFTTQTAEFTVEAPRAERLP